MKPIQSAWNITKAAVCLANEWRDTISYIVGGAFLGANSFHTGTISDNAIGLAAMREFSRACLWFSSRHLRVGQRLSPVNPVQCANSAIAASFGIGVLQHLNEMMSYHHTQSVWLGLDLLFCLTATSASGGPMRVLKDYSETMWDYPRKKGGGGTTQTQKLKEGFSKLGKMIGNLGPQPIPDAARTMHPVQKNAALSKGLSNQAIHNLA